MSLAERKAEPDGGELEVIEFEIQERAGDGLVISNFFGINVNKVREVIKTPPISHTFKDHPALEGVIDLRGDIIPVINLPKWLDKYDPRLKYERTIIVEFNMLRAGFLVSRVNRIHRVPFADLVPPAHLMAGSKQAAATGMILNEGRVVMMLDLEKLLADIDPETETEGGEIEPAPLPGGSVMVVEDSSLARGRMEKAISEAGYAVIPSPNGVDAMRQLEALHENARNAGRPLSEFARVVTADMEMPLMDGLNLARAIKADKRFGGIKVIIYSSMASPERAEQWKAQGADGCICKPDIAGLIRKINEFSR